MQQSRHTWRDATRGGDSALISMMLRYLLPLYDYFAAPAMPLAAISILRYDAAVIDAARYDTGDAGAAVI